MKYENLELVLKSIRGQLERVKKLFPKELDVILFTSYYKENRELVTKELISTTSPNNLSYYNDRLERAYRYKLEYQRFSSVLKLRQFRVICNDNYIAPFDEPNEFNWVFRGRKYVVTRFVRYENEECFMFELKDLETGIRLTPPKPYGGYNSHMFVLEDYTKLN